MLDILESAIPLLKSLGLPTAPKTCPFPPLLYQSTKALHGTPPLLTSCISHQQDLKQRSRTPEAFSDFSAECSFPPSSLLPSQPHSSCSPPPFLPHSLSEGSKLQYIEMPSIRNSSAWPTAREDLNEAYQHPCEQAWKCLLRPQPSLQMMQLLIMEDLRPEPPR